MTLDSFRGRVAAALGGDGLAVYADFPDASMRVESEPFAVLSLESLELKALGFGHSVARRGIFKFRMSAYASDGDAASAALQKLAARTDRDELRTLLGDARFTARGLRDARFGLVAADAELCGNALIELGRGRDAEVIVLNFHGKLTEKIEG